MPDPRRSATHNIRFRCNTPVLVTSLGETLDDVRLVAHEPEQTHYLLSASSDTASPAFQLHFPFLYGGMTHRLSISLCSASFKINTSSSIPSTSYSMLWISGPKASVMSSIKAYEIQSEVTEM